MSCRGIILLCPIQVVGLGIAIAFVVGYDGLLIVNVKAKLIAI